MKMVKLITIALAAVILVIAVIVAYIALTFDAARIKQEMAKAVLEKTGRTLTMDGDVVLRFWPSLGLKADKVALSEHNSTTVFAKFASANVSVKVMPLLSKQIAANDIELDGLNVVLIRDRDGHLNIDDLLGNNTGKNEQTPPPEIDVSSIRISDAQIEWRDLKAKSNLKIANLDLSTGHIVSNQSGQSVAALKLSTRGKRDADNFDLALDIPAFSRSNEQLAAAKVSVNAGVNGVGRKATVRLEVSNIEGTLQALKIGGFALDLDAQMGDKSVKGNLKSPVTLDMDTSTLLLPDLSGVLALDMPGLPSHPLSLPLKGRIKSEYARPAVSGNLSTRFDESSIDARFNVIGGSRSNIGIELDIDKLNVDKYLPPAAAAKAEKNGDDKIDFSALKAINGSGSLHVGDLQVKNVKVKNLRVSFKAANGKVDITPHSADLYGGHVSGGLSLDATGNRIAVKETLAGVNIQPLLKDLAGKDIVEGRGDIMLDVAMRGETVTAMKKALSGNARAALKDGAIKGVNIAQMLRTAKARLSGGDVVQPANANDKTDFSELGASFVIANGVAHNEDLSAKSPFLRLGGSGDIDIGNSQLNYLLKAAVVSTAAGQGGKETDSLKGITVPVRVTGPFAQPAFKLELANLVSDSAKARIEEKQQQVKQKVQDNVKDKLKGLFKK